MSNAFIPLLAVQVEGQKSPTARKVLPGSRNNYGREVDLDGDGHPESYYYHTDPALCIAMTGIIATGPGHRWRFVAAAFPHAAASDPG